MWLWILVGFVVLILVASFVLLLLVPPTPGINVTGITITSSDNVCGLNGATSSGFTANPGSVVDLAFSVSGNTTSSGGTANCTITAVTSATSGFLVSGTNAPLHIPTNANETLEFNVTCPNADYSGTLTLSFT